MLKAGSFVGCSKEYYTMSRETVIAFVKKVAIDTNLQKQVMKLNESDMDRLLELAATNGFPFTAKEWHTTVETAVLDGAELSDEQLERVAGGFNFQQYPASFNPTVEKFLKSFTTN
jgi:predicted ribosomally synthesized peptide with nif11-like leader